jgi:hypothetical protein
MAWKVCTEEQRILDHSQFGLKYYTKFLHSEKVLQPSYKWRKLQVA